MLFKFLAPKNARKSDYGMCDLLLFSYYSVTLLLRREKTIDLNASLLLHSLRITLLFKMKNDLKLISIHDAYIINDRMQK